jgi:hypothetical protein
MPMVLHRAPTRHVHLRSEDFDQHHHEVTCLVRTYRSIPVKGRKNTDMKLEDWVVIQARYPWTDVRVDI